MNELVGTWRLVRAVAWDRAGNALAEPYGGNGVGRIVFSPDGRMAVMMIDPRPDLPAGARRDYSGYSGPYSYDGRTLTTRVDTAPDASRIGSAQVRGVRFEDGLMVLRPPPREQDGGFEQRELYWERIAPV
jgi:hypothetical protein